jgi:hypothetical protein
MIFKEFVKEIRDLNSSTLLNKTVVCIAKDTLLIIGNKYKVHNEDSFSYLITGEYNDIKVWMMKSLFVTLDEYRDKQINSLLES